MTTLLKKKPSKDDLLDQVYIEFNDYDNQSSSVSSSSVNTSLTSSPILSSNNYNNDNNNNNNIGGVISGNFKLEQKNFIVDLGIMIFGVDIRSCAALRMGLALLVILDLYVRALYLRDHYSDFGVLPSNVVLESNSYYWSLYFLNPSVWFAKLLFILNGLFAFSMFIGYKSRLSSVVCWIFMTSLHTRNPYVLNGGDDFFRLFLFWAMFLPLGAKFSIDSLVNLDYTNRKSNCFSPKSVTYSPIVNGLANVGNRLDNFINRIIPNTDSDGKYVLSIGSIGIQIQFCLVYILTAALKTDPEWWAENSAVWYALHLDQFATPLGIWLRQFIGLGQFLTWFTIRYEWIGVFFFFVPWRKLHGPIRTIGVIGFWCMHFGFGSCLELGFFMYIPGICSLIFLPSWFWDKLFNYFYSNSLSSHRTTAQIWLNPNTNDSLYKCVSIFKQFFLLHSTPILISQPIINNLQQQHQHQQQQQQQQQYNDEEDLNDGIINNNNNNIYNDMKEKNYWLAIESSITGERVFGYDAFLTLISLSPTPIQYLNFWIFNRRYFKEFYGWLVSRSWFSNTKENPMFKATNYIYPKKAVVSARKWYIELFCLFMLFFIVNWNCAGYFSYDVSASYKWVGPAFKVEQYWSMFSPHPSKDNGWLVYPAVLVDGTEIDVITKKPITYDRPKLISSTFPTQRWRKYLMNLQGLNHRDKRLYYGRYICREWNWYGTTPPHKHIKAFKLIFMYEESPQFPYPVNNRTIKPQEPPTPIELWSHVC
ncbi:hypothetical protein ACTFIU_006162 [Dictyostelium citrinum]